MKCICGYEQEADFQNCGYKSYIAPTITAETVYKGLFVCPVCGTVKMKLDNPIKSCGSDKADIFVSKI